MLKDWKLRSHDWWTKGSKGIMIYQVQLKRGQTYSVINQLKTFYRVRLHTGGFDDIPETELQKIDFKTKPEAMRFAKRYMRTH